MGELPGVGPSRPSTELTPVERDGHHGVPSKVIPESQGGKEGIEIIAHRGFSARFPENTLPSLLGAVEAGADALEWDIRIAADGVPVLFHDECLERTTDGRGYVGSRTSAELARLDAGSWLSADFVGTRVPSLRETLAGLHAWKGRVYPEVKGRMSEAGLDSVLRLLREAGFLSRTVLISLNHGLLEEVRARDAEIHLGWVVAREEDMERCTRRVSDDGRAVLDPAAQLLMNSPARTREIVTAGIPLATWTVDEAEEAQALFDLGVKRITTNQVGRMARWARSVEASRDRE